MLLVNNLSSRKYDAYCFPASTLSLSVLLLPTKFFKKNSVFLEGSKVAICGGEGATHVVDMVTGQSLQSLEISQGSSIQTLKLQQLTFCLERTYMYKLWLQAHLLEGLASIWLLEVKLQGCVLYQCGRGT